MFLTFSLIFQMKAVRDSRLPLLQTGALVVLPDTYGLILYGGASNDYLKISLMSGRKIRCSPYSERVVGL